MVPPKYAQRIARLPEVFEILAGHPGGLALTDLAQRVGVPAAELHEDLLAFYTADVQVLLGLSRPPVLEFLSAEGDDEEPNTATVVRLVHERPEELGVEYVDAAELALVYTAARSLLDLEPDNADLAGAVEVLEDFVGDPRPAAAPAAWNAPLADLQAAVRDRRRVRITYSRAWYAGVTEKVIEPYRLVQTRRGWEVDAGPVRPDGSIRTYLLSNIRDHEVLDEAFEPPADLDALVDQQRATRTVRVRLPHAARWAADFYAEGVAVVADDEDTVTLDLALLPPVDHRVGLLGLAAGPDIQVLDPPGLVAAVGDLARELLAHQRG